MQVESFSLRLRPRGLWEAADLGIRLAQESAKELYLALALAALPVLLLTIACFSLWPALALPLVWWLKPWLDRSLLFVLSRAAFGQRTRPADLWRAKRSVWGGQLLATLTLRRLSPWRSFSQPVHQLEGQSGTSRRDRLRQIRVGRSGTAMLVTSAFATIESLLALAAMSLAYWFAPASPTSESSGLLAAYTVMGEGITVLGYALVVFLLEPLYVAAGFAMYINRRVELEAWDLEQEFRRAFVR